MANANHRSVADILAAARSSDGGQRPAAVVPESSTTGDAAAKGDAAAATPKRRDDATPQAVRRDTAGILAAARQQASAARRTSIATTAASVARPERDVAVRVDKPTALARPTRPGGGSASFQRPPRRGFLWVGLASLGGALALWCLAAVRYMFPNVLQEPPSKFKAGLPETLPPGAVETKYKSAYGVWIVRGQYGGRQQIYALKAVCTHLGCTPNWLEAEQKFKCPCHGSGFHKDGIHFEGPAPRPLERFAIRVADDGQIEVDKSRTYQEELGQWTDPGCFILV